MAQKLEAQAPLDGKQRSIYRINPPENPKQIERHLHYQQGCINSA